MTAPAHHRARAALVVAEAARGLRELTVAGIRLDHEEAAELRGLLDGLSPPARAARAGKART